MGQPNLFSLLFFFFERQLPGILAGDWQVECRSLSYILAHRFSLRDESHRLSWSFILGGIPKDTSINFQREPSQSYLFAAFSMSLQSQTRVSLPFVHCTRYQFHLYKSVCQKFPSLLQYTEVRPLGSTSLFTCTQPPVLHLVFLQLKFFPSSICEPSQFLHATSFQKKFYKLPCPVKKWEMLDSCPSEVFWKLTNQTTVSKGRPKVNCSLRFCGRGAIGMIIIVP